MSHHNLFTLSADGAVVPASSQTILIAARQVLAHRVRRGASLQSPQKAGEYLTARLGHLDYEVFGLIQVSAPGEDVKDPVHFEFQEVTEAMVGAAIVQCFSADFLHSCYQENAQN